MPKKQHYREFYKLIATIRGEKEAELLMKDLLTPQELDSVTERWQEIQLLAQGMTQRDIAEKLNISISKITRGSRVLQYGTGGFAHFLKKLKKTSGRTAKRKTS
ncbi:helix-turn-helix domain-containing protein [Candidatus Uhrbacteria bacterium]|nr:helix-turn-helix domain-containing protein [Candidatus Uhrbacteria bacterium]